MDFVSEKTAYFALFRFHLIDTLKVNTTLKKTPPVDKTELKYRHITDIFKTAQGAYLSAVCANQSAIVAERYSPGAVPSTK